MFFQAKKEVMAMENRRKMLIASSIGLAALGLAAGAFYWVRRQQRNEHK